MLQMIWMRELSTTPLCQLVRSPTRRKSQSPRQPQSTSVQRACLAEALEEKARRPSPFEITGMMEHYKQLENGETSVLTSVADL
jgi:hypothetical protein